jgi:phage terminase Nu1 subunit (DNA packaging protein)
LILAAAVLLAVAGGLVWFLSRGKSAPAVTPATAPLDPYAASLSIANLAMSESSSLAGGKVTYLDGQITNHGQRTVTAISIQVLFRDYAREIAWNETQSLQLIRTRDPEVDTEPVSAAPLKPGDQREFRLIFDSVPDSWDGAYPDLRLVHADLK